jgi:predicted metal-dependent phosphoesterase TrpH
VYGGTAIEVVTGSHTLDQFYEYTKVANRYGFAGSRGSDFHSPDDKSPDLGRLPPLAKSLTPVWADWF